MVASVSVPDARSITVSVWDKGMAISVEKAIRSSGLGLNPVVEGQTLRLPIPPLTEDRRKDLVKVVRQKAEDGKVQVRNHRRSSRQELDQLEKDAAISSDEHERLGKEIEKLTHTSIESIDELLTHKEQELLEV